MKRSNKSNWSLARKLILLFCGMGLVAIVVLVNYWSSAFPALDDICMNKPLMLINNISSCTEPSVFKESLNAGGYQYSEDSFRSSKAVLNPGLDFLNITVNRYKISSCIGEARFRFVNSYLSSATFFPLDTCEFDLTESAQDIKVKEGENFEGRKFFFWGDERLETYYRNWLDFFS